MDQINQNKNNHKFEKVFILDTNIILDDASNLFNISQNGKNLIVLPETVIDELDNKKSGFDEINFQAREFGRILSEAKVIKTRESGSTKNVNIISLEINDIFIDIISFRNYYLDNVERTIINDRKIIKVAQFSKKYYNAEDIIFLSNDIMCRTRAISLNVKTEGLITNKELIRSNFIKVIENFDSSLFKEMENDFIEKYDPEYKIENYCYHFQCSDGNTKIAYIVDKKITFINDSDFDSYTIKPLNLGQRFAMAGMIEPRYSVCLIDAKAGSGKTLLAVSAGIGLVKKGDFDKIIYIRNSVESVDKAEEVGFLPGLETKFAIYNYSLYDTLEFIVQHSLKQKEKEQNKVGNQLKNDHNRQEYVQSEIDELQRRYNIETCWPGSIRGRTFSNAFVIIDECLEENQIVYTNYGKMCIKDVLYLYKEKEIKFLSKNLKTNEIQFKELESLKVQKFNNSKEKMYKITLEDGSSIKVTGNHKLFINNKYQKVIDVINSEEDLYLENL